MYRQAIQTRYYCPTDRTSARFRATAQAGSVVISYDYKLNHDENHRAAAEALARKFGWDFGPYVGGQLKDGSYVFVSSAD